MRPLLDALAVSTDLTLISPAAFAYAYGPMKAEFTGAEPYGVRTYECRFPVGLRTSTRWVYSSRDLDFETLRPEIVHVENEPHSFSVLQAIWAGRSLSPRPRIVVSSWGNRWPPAPKSWALRALVRSVRSHIDLFVSANAAGKALLARDGIPEDRVEVFPSTSVDMSYYRPLESMSREDHRRSLGLPPQAFIVGYSGRFVPEKGIDDLVAAVERLRPGSRRELVVLCIGDGPLKPTLERIPGVRLASPGADGRVLPYYRAMDAFVLASKPTPVWEEQFGRSIVEAMACGVPVIGSQSGAIPEVVGSAGLLFAPGAVQELAERLAQLIDDQDARRGHQRAGLERVREWYSVQAIAGRTLMAYEKVLGRPRSGSYAA
jgi:glycosyltransferase involved in cell wall biosynthesis